VDLVLGGDDGKECTYAGGYLKRQAVFSCITCVPDGVAGVCTACSLACHDGHEVSLLTLPMHFPSKINGGISQKKWDYSGVVSDPEQMINFDSPVSVHPDILQFYNRTR
jgi:hypothetical protein